MAYQFFTSYARVNQGKPLEKFVRELKKQVLDKTGVKPEEVCFYDQSEIKTGQVWARVLGEALRKSKTLVCLCTTHYQGSEFCGKEVEVFVLRRNAYLSKPENAGRNAWLIFPVIWELPVGGLHPELGHFQFTDGAMPKKYAERGLNALAMLNKERDNFLQVVITLAERIRDAIQESSLPEWPPLPPFEVIGSVFHRAPSQVRHQCGVVVVHPEGLEWKPYGDTPAAGCLTWWRRRRIVCAALFHHRRIWSQH